ncbi:kinesin motor protein cin8 [Ascosphaera aggregata]|nr:kinesin motor protein cin8 [Ascosphaera aggregata]
MAGPTRSQPAQSGTTATTRRAIPRATSSRTSRIPSNAYSRPDAVSRSRQPSATPVERLLPDQSIPTSTSSSSSPSNQLTNTAVAAPSSRLPTRDLEHHGPSEKTNIYVVVRCRGRNDQEVKEKSGMVISTEGVKGENLEVNMGPNALANKLYQFDRVFSPAADQSVVFDDVVMPVLNEMLSGYNCTIFAYGQTGTGKTYTMSGDMTDTMGILSDAAGIIPRALYALFQKLEDREASVKCSFIELYNEELRDLLSEEEGTKLKIYDDNSGSKKGSNATMVQGMGETWIHDASQGIKLLQTGSYKRQVASTKCNDLSSRSHTVFTVTAYIKRTSDKGDEFVSSGKLNLVDLAGSENIGKSGAENKRATEAGLINKSLLTLGRVINALVDGTNHIPYRESKLTRLLQDSLGGHTKTCIIATISPSRANLEETVSTLDYAFRAKNIRNKPQMNSTLSKKTMLREFTIEIEKLKAELIATRLRNGVYLPNMQYEELTMESESRRILTEEQRARIETMEVSLKNKLQELLNVTGNFNSLKKEHEETKRELRGTGDLLKQTDIILERTKKELDEEVLVRQAHEKTETELRGIGTDLISGLKEKQSDVQGLFEKIERKDTLEQQNHSTWTRGRETALEVIGTVDGMMEGFEAQQSSALQQFQAKLEGYISNELSRLTISQGTAGNSESGFDGNVNGTKEENARCRDQMNEVIEGIKDIREDVKEKINDGLSGLTAAAGRISGEVIKEVVDFSDLLKKSYQQIGENHNKAMKKLTSELEEQREETTKLREELRNANARAKKAEEDAKAKVKKLLEDEKESSNAERLALLGSIREMIEQQNEKRTKRIEIELTNVWNQVDNATTSLHKAHAKYDKSMKGIDERNASTLRDLDGSGQQLSLDIEAGASLAEQKTTAIASTARAVHAETGRIVKDEMEGISSQMAALDEFVARARSANDGHHQARIERLDALTESIRGCFKDVRFMLDNFKQSTETFSEDVKGSTELLQVPVEKVCAEVRRRLKSLRETIEQAVIQEYVSTGKTPVKRAGLLDTLTPGKLPRTVDRRELLARLNEDAVSDIRIIDEAKDGGMELISEAVEQENTPVKVPLKFDSPAKGTKSLKSPRKKSESKEKTPMKKRSSPAPFAFTRTSDRNVSSSFTPTQDAESVVEPAKPITPEVQSPKPQTLRELDGNVPFTQPTQIDDESQNDKAANEPLDSISATGPAPTSSTTVATTSTAPGRARDASQQQIPPFIRKRSIQPPASVRKTSSALPQKLGRRKVMDGAETPAAGKKRRLRIQLCAVLDNLVNHSTFKPTMPSFSQLSPFSSQSTLFVQSVALRIILFSYGLYQDAHFPAKYTDIDYLVFTDAARFVSHGGSPYERATYRYTPVLAWVLLPTSRMGGLWFSFGKALFAAADILAGWLLIKILRQHLGMGQSTALSKEDWTGGGAARVGCALEDISFIYGISILWALDEGVKGERISLSRPSELMKLINKSRVQLLLTSLAVFMLLNAIMYRTYGLEFLQHTYFHHFTRVDHRHNFSPYNMLLYLSSAAPREASTGIYFESLAFIPQLTLSAILIPLCLAKKELAGCMLAQTFAFVAFNKVCTSQALWLQQGFELEFLGQSTFSPGLFLSSLLFFLTNVWILGIIVTDIAGYKLEKKKSK